jgi:hypothetical protein
MAPLSRPRSMPRSGECADQRDPENERDNDSCPIVDRHSARAFGGFRSDWRFGRRGAGLWQIADIAQRALATRFRREQRPTFQSHPSGDPKSAGVRAGPLADGAAPRLFSGPAAAPAAVAAALRRGGACIGGRDGHCGNSERSEKNDHDGAERKLDHDKPRLGARMVALGAYGPKFARDRGGGRWEAPGVETRALSKSADGNRQILSRSRLGLERPRLDRVVADAPRDDGRAGHGCDRMPSR